MLRLRLLAVVVLVSLFVGVLAPTPATAATPTNKGLLISPLKTYSAVNAGSTKTSTITVANLTEQPITVKFSIKQFSVSDYAYDFHFTDPGNNWVVLDTLAVQLQPNESKNVPYTITAPTGSAPGGYYYTFIASANLSTAGIVSTVQAASLLYLTVTGKLVETSAPIHSTINHFVYQGDVHYSFDVKNTGNVHYFAYFSGSLHSLFGRTTMFGTSHLLLPGTTRRVSGIIPAPLLPGIYKAYYGYKTDAGAIVMHSSYLIYIPPWSVAALLLVLFAVYKFWRYRQRYPKQRS